MTQMKSAVNAVKEGLKGGLKGLNGLKGGLKSGLKGGLLNGGGIRARRADTFALEVASLRRERRLLGKSLKAWMRRARRMLLKRRTQEALEEKAHREQDTAS